MSNHHNPFDLTGHLALVTGASKGMGRAIAAILAQAGARVVVSSRQQVDCDRVAAEISPQPGQSIGIASDMGDSETLKALVSAAREKIGNPDILVCNAAGGAPIGALDSIEMKGFDQAMISNVRNNLFLAKLVAPDMVARRDGSIIIMSSIVGGRGRAGMGIYSTTKAAVNQLVRTMAVEWGRTKCVPTLSRRRSSARISPVPSGKLPTRLTAQLPECRWVDWGKRMMSPDLLFYWPRLQVLLSTARSLASMAGLVRGRHQSKFIGEQPLQAAVRSLQNSLDADAC